MRRHYKVTPSLIGCAQTYNQPWNHNSPYLMDFWNSIMSWILVCNCLSNQPSEAWWCASASVGHHCFKSWIVACLAPTRYLSQCWLSLRDRYPRNINWNTKFSLKLNALENAVYKMSAILFRPLSVNWQNMTIKCSLISRIDGPYLHKESLVVQGLSLLSIQFCLGSLQ